MTITTKSTTELTWEAMKEAANIGILDQLIHSGDQIPVTLKNGEEVIFDVAHDETGKIFFVAHDCLNEQAQMNESYTNEGGWDACKMRSYLNSEIFALLPDDLQEAIVPTTIVQIIDGERVESNDALFLLSRTQVFGKGPWSECEPEDSQLDIFPTERSRVKECGNNGTWFWWERTPYSGTTDAFGLVSYSGGASGGSASYANGVAPGFCI